MGSFIFSNDSGKFAYTVCPGCGIKLEIDYNDNWPGFGESEDVYCPKCEAFVMSVHTSGTPTANVIYN